MADENVNNELIPQPEHHKRAMEFVNEVNSLGKKYPDLTIEAEDA